MSESKEDLEIQNIPNTADKQLPKKDKQKAKSMKAEKVELDFEKARQHGFATRVRHIDLKLKKEKGKAGLCECCHEPLYPTSTKFPLCIDTQELKEIGTGFPLFFYLKKWFIGIFFSMFIFVGSWSMVVNIRANKGSEWIEDDTPSVFVTY